MYNYYNKLHRKEGDRKKKQNEYAHTLTEHVNKFSAIETQTQLSTELTLAVNWYDCSPFTFSVVIRVRWKMDWSNMTTNIRWKWFHRQQKKVTQMCNVCMCRPRATCVRHQNVVKSVDNWFANHYLKYFTHRHRHLRCFYLRFCKSTMPCWMRLIVCVLTSTEYRDQLWEILTCNSRQLLRDALFSIHSYRFELSFIFYF